ncbi:hypothetical protein P170DRAFT_431732, partial [Aspergillus steynii IBT 23096]
MSAPQALQSLSTLGSSVGQYGRQQVSRLQNRLFKTDKSRRRAQIVQGSFMAHRPVWLTAGGAAYTTAGAVYLTLQYMRRL